MKLNAPKNLTFFISLILIIAGPLLFVLAIPALAGISQFYIWITFAGGALLALGCMLKGL